LGLTNQAWILLADVRDTIFQRDPFSLLPPVASPTPTTTAAAAAAAAAASAAMAAASSAAPASALYLFGDAIPFHKCDSTGSCTGPEHIDSHSYVNLFNFINNRTLHAEKEKWFAESSMDDLVLCSGTTMGTADAVTKYLNAMTTLFSTMPEFSNGGVDQGYHNWVSDTVSGQRVSGAVSVGEWCCH
jgi:hypothetical protein